MAFLGLYVFYSILMYVLVRKATGFAWSRQNARLFLAAVGVMITAGIGQYSLLGLWGTALNLVLTAAVGCYCVKTLARLTQNTEIHEYFTIVRLLPPPSREIPPA